RLAEFAVARRVDADLGLPRHNFGNGTLQAVLVGLLVIGLPALLSADELQQRRRTDEAADVGSENALGAAPQIASSSPSSCVILSSHAGDSNRRFQNRRRRPKEMRVPPTLGPERLRVNCPPLPLSRSSSF